MFTNASEIYYQRIVGVMEYAATLDPQAPGAALENDLTERCPECGQVPTGTDAYYHKMHDGNVIIGCEGYYVIDPGLVGLATGNWMDFRDGINNFETWQETGLND